MRHFLLPVLVAGVAFAAVFATVEVLARRGPLTGERGRKAAHVAGGTLTAALPAWLGAAQVVTLAGAFLLAFALDRRVAVLRCVHGEPGRGVGELVFCGGIAAAAATVGVGAAFVAAMLTLALADAAAAVTGMRFPRHRLPGPLSGKTWVGSIACGASAAAVCAAVLVATSGSGAGALLSWQGGGAVALVALAATAAEAVTGQGWDNLSVPVVVAWGWTLLLSS